MLNEKSFYSILYGLMLVSLGGCATYNSIAPDWAQIGAESSEATTDDESASEADGEFTWWNPLSWF